MAFLWFTGIFLPMHSLCDKITFGRVGGDVQTDVNLLTINSYIGVRNKITCAMKCADFGCLAFTYTDEETACVTYSIQCTGQRPGALVTKYFARSGIWTISVYISTDFNAESGDTLFVDVEGTLSSVSKINLGNNLQIGEIRQHIYIANFGEISNIRLYLTESDGLNIVKATLEDEDGHLYTFPCNCWIDTDEVGPGIQPSWLLYPQT